MKQDFELKARLMLVLGATYEEAHAKLIGKVKRAKVVKRPASTWEKLTGGRCNDGGVAVEKRELSHAEFKKKAMNRKAAAKAEVTFEKMSHVQGKAKRMMADDWRNRVSTNVAGFYDQKKARAIKRGEV